MKNKWLIILLIFSVTINLAAIATILFQYWRMPPPDLRFSHIRPACQLSPHEQELLRANYFNLIEHTHSQKQEIEEMRHHIFQSLIATEIDSIRIEKQLDTLAGMQKEIQKQIIFSLLKQRQFLDEPSYQQILHQYQARFIKPYHLGRHGGRKSQFRHHRQNPDESRK